MLTTRMKGTVKPPYRGKVSTVTEDIRVSDRHTSIHRSVPLKQGDAADTGVGWYGRVN